MSEAKRPEDPADKTAASPPGPTPGTPPADGERPPPDMASLMMELARIRRDVEGQAEPGQKASWRAWVLLALTLGALAWWLFGKTGG